MIALFETAAELGLITALTVLALFLSYSMLNVCDLSTDGSFTLGACVGGVIALSGHPYLALLCAILAGNISGITTAFIQTYMGINSLLAGIVVNTGLYSINIAIMSGSSLLNLNKTDTIFTTFKSLLKGTPLSSSSKLVVVFFVVLVVVLLLDAFLKTKLGLAIRATGNNPIMVKASSINPKTTTIIGLALSNGLTALSGCLLAMSQKSVSIDMGQGILTIALASLLIGTVFIKKGSILVKAFGAVLGSIIFRVVYTLALRFDMPAYMLKLVSSVIVIIVLFIPYIKKQLRKEA